MSADRQHPRQQRRRRRLPVRAGDDEIVPPAQEKLLQHLRQREVIKLPVQDRLHLRIAALDRIADHHHLGIVRQILRPIRLGRA